MVLTMKLLPLHILPYLIASHVDAAHLKFDFTKEERAVPQLARRANSLGAPLLEVKDNRVYAVNVSIGTPPQHVLLQLDTGSSNVWTEAASSKFCEKGGCELSGSFNQSQSSTFKGLLPGGFAAGYGTGFAKGDVFTDVFNIGGVDIKNLTMGLAFNVSGQSGDFPIMGIGLDVEENFPKPVPGVLDSLVSNGIIERRAFSLYLDDQEAGRGSILFGGIDSSKYEGDLISLPIAPNGTGTYDRYRVDLTSISFDDPAGHKTVLTPSNMSTPAVLDSGTSNLVLSESLTDAIVKGIGAVPYENAAYLVDCSYRNSNASFAFQFGGSGGPSVNVPINQVISDFNLGSFSNGVSACALDIQFASQDAALMAGTGGLLLGDVFIRNAYLVYDVDNLEIAMAQAVYNQTGNGSITEIPAGSGLPGVSSTATGKPTTVPTTLPASATASGTASANGSMTASTSATATAAGTTTTTGPMTFSITPSSPTFDLGTATGQVTIASSTSGAPPNMISQGKTMAFGVLLLLCILI